MATEMMATEDAVRLAIETVVDPCSVSAGAPLSLGAMGLVESVQCDGGDVVVRLALTGPGCLYGGLFATAVRREVEALPGVQSVSVVLDTEVVWAPSRMSSDGAAALLAARARTAALTGIRPFAERPAS